MEKKSSIKAIKWSHSATKELNKIYENILEDSEQNANNILDEILSKTEALKEQPERYPRDKYKKNNKGNYRSFEYKKIRVSYKILKDIIDIVRVRSTHQEPKNY
ncbi:MAG: type II toxin-antitoxin system RelE/ParE family toxin [Chitinophagales bacterium]|nr:type II toxin-antitoxin system RelE/ParE family toxin [Chitinophagales bacterium]